MTEGTSKRFEGKENTLVLFFQWDNKPTAATRVLRKMGPQGSKAATLNTEHYKTGNTVGLRSMGSGQGRGMAPNAVLAFPIKEVLDCLIPFPKTKGREEVRKEVLRPPGWVAKSPL